MKCSECGFENAAEMKFCRECGKPLAPSSKPLPPPPDPRSYTPKHLPEKILTSRSALEGERKQVTVLFAGIKGSTELMEDLARPTSPLAFGACRYAEHVSEHSSPGDSARCTLVARPSLSTDDGDASLVRGTWHDPNLR
jgi:zinc-ribbon domain